MSLQALQLSCIRGEHTLFGQIAFGLEPGQALHVRGTNGSGKTSLLRILCGLAMPATGAVLWQGKNILAAREEFSRDLLYLGHANGVKDDLLAWENIVVGATLSGRPVGRDDALAALTELGLGRAARLPTRALSQGQRKRVALARLRLAGDSRLWVLDEPFTALDQAAIDQLCGTINEHLARGGMLVYTTHQEIALGAGRSIRLDLDRGALC